MNRKIKISEAIAYSIIVITVLICILIYPFNVIKKEITLKTPERLVKQSDAITVDSPLVQMFVGQGGMLKGIDVYVDNDMYGETISFRLYDGSFNILYEALVTPDMSDVSLPGLVSITMNVETTRWNEYYYSIEGLSTPLYVQYEDIMSSPKLVNGTLSHGDIPIEGLNIVSRYHYIDDYPSWQKALIIVLLLFGALALVGIVQFAFTKIEHINRVISVQFVLKITLIPLIIVGAVLSIISIMIYKTFGITFSNNIFMSVGVLTLAIILIYVISYSREGDRPLCDVVWLKSNVPSVIQSIFIGMTLWYCYEYLNGLYDINHHIAIRKILIYFLLSIVLMFDVKQLMHFGNILYAGIGIWFYNYYITLHDVVELELEKIKYEGALIVVAIFVITHTLVRIARRQIKCKISIFMILTSIVLLLLTIFSNTREWPAVLLCMLALFYINYIGCNDNIKLSQSITNGIIINFIYVVVYCLMHRPLRGYYFYRYPMMYHTVTMTSVYLTLVMTAILVKLLAKRDSANSIREVWGELLLFGIAGSYMFMTLSRTGYFALLVVIIFVFLLRYIGATKYKARKKLLLLDISAILIAIVVCFPITFTATRIIPAVYREPVYSEIENNGYTIDKVTSPDSLLYLDIERFIGITSYKLFNLNKDTYGYLDTNNEELCLISEENRIVSEISNNSILGNLCNYMGGRDTMIGIRDIGSYIVSTEENALDQSVEEDFSNGRIDTFKLYMEQWNLFGHDDMGVLMPDGSMTVHAHNIYLQVAHDHGIIVGIVFVLYGIISVIVGSIYYFDRSDEDKYALLTPAMLVAFGSAGVVEWVFHPANPLGLVTFIAISPLLVFRLKKRGVQ